MSNRNFDASVIAKRLRDQNVAQQLYGSFINSKAPGNPQTVSTQVGIITTEYYPGVQTTVEQSLQSNYTFSPGGIANYVPDPNAGPTIFVPTAPTIDSITAGNTVADVYFTAGSDGGSVITDYKYALDSGSGFGSFISGGLSNPLAITGLINGVTYQIKILAVNAVGDGAESNTLSVTPVTTPSAPQNLTVTPAVGSVNLYFTPPADDGGDAISNYKYSTDNGASWSFAGTTSSPITVTGLQQNGTLYDVKLLAVNAVGDGAATSAISVAALSTFSPSDIANQNVWLDAQNPISVILSSGQVTAWNDSSIASNNFAKGPSGTITYDFPSGINSRPALNFTTSAPSLSTYLGKDNFNIAPTNQLTVFLVVRQTGNGVGNSELFFTRNNYQYMDIFNNTNSTGILSANIGNATQRSTGVNIITPTTNTIISFVADSTVDMFVNGSSTLVSSTVRGGLSLNDSTLDWAISGGAFLGNFGELITYSTPLTTIQRQAVEGYLAWKWGTQDSLPIGHPYTSVPPSITVPNPPTGLGATPGNGQADISFTPGSDGGSAISNYKYSTDGTNYIAISPADASSPITITGLTNGTTYSITLKAVNAIGDSISSASVSVTPVDPFTIETFTTIGTTSWTAPLGITTVEYLIVGGGGGGGGGYDTGGGGGGGGGMVLTGSLAVTAGASYNIEVGAGGSASTNNYPTVGETAGGTGGNSIFATITALGGDGGSGSRTQTGGSGKGGDAQNSNVSSAVGGSGGGNAGTSAGGSGGGGGGATGNGANGVPGSGGLGGTGLTSSISGSSITYGIGGSGARGSIATTGSAGTANRGNGGGGSGFSSGGARNGGAGGSGIVILKY